jgi:hypothetical protein
LRRVEEPAGADLPHALESLSGPALTGAGVAGLVYVMRLVGFFPHPFEHLVGVLCFAAILLVLAIRVLRELTAAQFPRAWGGVVSVALAFAAAIGLLVELSLATSVAHNENHPHRVFQRD